MLINFKMIKNNAIFKLAFFIAALGLIILLTSVVLVVSDSNHFILDWHINLEKAANLGSFIGGLVGSIWTLSGIILLIGTFIEQQKQFERQQFENVFFEMLNILHDIVYNANGKIIFPSSNESPIDENPIKSYESEGVVFFNDALKYFQYILEFKSNGSNLEIFEPSTLIFRKSYIVKEYENFHIKYRSQLSHYFRYLYNILKFVIDEREIHNDEKRYIDMIQAQISTGEMGLIFYNALSKYALNQNKFPQFFEWLDNYSFLENISVESLIAPDNYKYYPQTKFKFLKY
jgi:hypothetical protein